MARTLIVIRRRPPAVGPDRGRGQQERGAAAAGGVPADDGDLRDSQRAADSRRRRDDRAAAIARRRGRRARARRRCASRAGDIASSEPDPQLVGRLRGSVLLLGALLGRTGRAMLAPPGGDFPARRTITTHLRALRAMGARIVESPAGTSARGARRTHRRVDVPARGLGDGHGDRAAGRRAGDGRRPRSATRRASRTSPSCAQFLRRWAPDVAGHRHRRRSASRRPRACTGATHTLRGDYIEAASWGVVGAITGGEIEVAGAHAAGPRADRPRCWPRWAWTFELEDGRFAVRPSKLVGARRITTGLWPGFPSDIVSLVTVLATQADGRTLVHDWMYELRLFALEQLSAMRADLFLCDPHRIIVTGPTTLRGPDARQPRHPVRHGAHRRRARGRRREHGARDRNGRARLRQPY